MTDGLIAPILVLRARAEARALLYACNEFDFGEATDPLMRHAFDAGLVELLGTEAVEQIILDAFGIQPA